MKVGKWRIEFKTTITGVYKNVKDVPFWRVYIVRRIPAYDIDKTGEVICTGTRMIKYHRSIVAMTYDEVIDQFKDTDVLNIAGFKLDPAEGFYAVAYPRKSCKVRV